METPRVIKPQPSLLGLPQELRLTLIENYLPNPNDHLKLRSVCKILQYEIDQLVGIKNVIFIDEDLIKDPDLHDFITTAALRHTHCSNIPNISLNEILAYPCKLESTIFDEAIRSQFLSEFLQQCHNLKSLTLTADIIESTLEVEKIQEFPHLEILDVTTGAVVKPDTKYLYCKMVGDKYFKFERFNNALTFLKSIYAPRLTKLKFRLIISLYFDYDPWEVSSTFLEFISTHSRIKTLELNIKYDDKPSNISTDVANQVHSTFQNLKNQHKPISAEMLNRLDCILKGFKNSPGNSIEHIAFESELDKGKDHWMQFFKMLKNLKSFGVKLSGTYSWVEICPVIKNNWNTLTKIFIQCYLTTSVDFNSFSSCVNLESISLHNIRGFEHVVIYLRNLSSGMDFLPKLESLILDGVAVNGNDMEDVASRKLKVLGLRSVSMRDYFGDDLVILPGDEDEDDEEEEGGGNQTVTGITYEAFMTMINNRWLDALLLDLDSISVTEFGKGVMIEMIRGMLFGNFRSFFLDFSDSDKFRYWKTSFLGFDVEFPIV